MDMQTVMKSLEEASKDKKVKFISDKGKNSCDKCLQYDGKIFNVDDPNLPQLPIHPNCRCKYETFSGEEIPQEEILTFVSEKPLHIKTKEAFTNFVQNAKNIYTYKVPKPPQLTDNKANWLNMTWMWFFEQGENPARFSADSPESKDIVNSFSMKQVKEAYFRTGKIPKGWQFTGPGTATGDYAEVEWFVGSFSIKDFKLKNGIATFKIYNTSGWRSGTRLPKSWTDSIKEKTSFEINELVTDAPRGQVIQEKIKKSYPALSKIPGSSYILKALPSFGGNWDQIYEIQMEWKE